MIRARVSSRDVAEAAGVSANTVSLVVRDSPLVTPETKAKVREVIARLGYRPHAAAAALRSARSSTLGYLVSRISGMSVPDVDVFHHQLVGAIITRARQADHYVLVDTLIDAERCAALVASGRIDGAVVDWLIDDTILRALQERRAPLVVAGRSVDDTTISWVKADEEGGAYAATRHLLDLGHRCLALLSVAAEHASAVSRERVDGYRRALAEAGLPLDQRYVALSDWTLTSGYELGRHLLDQRPRPTAIFALSEILATGLLQAAEAQGLRVPDDLAIAATENSPVVEYVRPRLSAVHVPMYEVGERATEVLLALLDDPGGDPRQIVLPTTFIARESSDPHAGRTGPAAGAPAPGSAMQAATRAPRGEEEGEREGEGGGTAQGRPLL